MPKATCPGNRCLVPQLWRAYHCTQASARIPENLLAEIDQLVEQRGRSAFLAEVVSRKVQRLKLLAALRDAKGSWKRGNHPELNDGWEQWVEQLRRENKQRLSS